MATIVMSCYVHLSTCLSVLAFVYLSVFLSVFVYLEGVQACAASHV